MAAQVLHFILFKTWLERGRETGKASPASNDPFPFAQGGKTFRRSTIYLNYTEIRQMMSKERNRMGLEFVSSLDFISEKT
jgi:hypothetical protein